MNKQNDDVGAIRQTMEESSNFLSLSGMPGVVAGVTALLGVAFCRFFILPGIYERGVVTTSLLWLMLWTALIVLVISAGCGILFSWRKARKQDERLFWSVGFGVCHILYGLIMYVKYDLKKQS